MRRLLLLHLLCLSAVFAVRAVPARPVTRTVRMMDGTVQTVVLRGDETFHFYSTLAGQPVREAPSGRWQPDTSNIAHRWAAARERRQQHRHRLAERQRDRMMARRGPGTAQPGSSVTSSAVQDTVPCRGLLILVNFRNLRMKWSSTPAVFQQMTNSMDAPYGRNHGSVREYFRSQSYGQFDVEFDVVGPVTLSKNVEYYGEDDNGEGEDMHPGQMVKEALRAIDDEVDFSAYDWDGDGEVENVFIVYAGYSQAHGAPSYTIWPHQWTLTEATASPYTADGVVIDTYACSSELQGTSGSTIDGIGTMCHEYSHCLGLPDFYDTGDQGGFGMGQWSVMDYGCYNANSYCPAAYTAYERWFCGWMQPQLLTAPCTVTALRNLEDYPEAYVIYNDQSPTEYFLLANHQQVGWNSAAYAHGMMILHVEYDATAWEENTVNNLKNRQRMTIVPADNRLDKSSMGLQGDLWPGTAGSNSFTDSSLPAARLNLPNTDGTYLLHKPLYDIAETDGLISFGFMQPATDAITVPGVSPSLPWRTAPQMTTARDLLGRPLPSSRTRGLSIINGHKYFIP